MSKETWVNIGNTYLNLSLAKVIMPAFEGNKIVIYFNLDVESKDYISIDFATKEKLNEFLISLRESSLGFQKNES